ncbi:unnamed protein product [Rotaria sp. Silwood2]|nr:unnamed protein product [Rotaria sp. Silwood2]CAF3461742.1 unnamed protein product [Rotaria sp. Silwood2]CAF4267907.1 unnamed protein product [Rotaria sp. Silwood2]CAF4517824.1 unnamed protein product [Rotaria sp. Silwood2]
MDNQGPTTNRSQFFITISKAEHLDGKHVVFSHVISGQSVVDTIQNISVDSNRRPLQDVVIVHCGQLILDSTKISVEEENKNDQLTNTTIEKSNEISDHEIRVPKKTIDLDVISKIPVARFFIQKNLNDDDDDDGNNNGTSHTSASDYLSSKRIDSSGRSIKGRGSVVLYRIFYLI